MQILLFTGIQGSGKTTFFKERFFKSHVLISLDLLKTRNRERRFMSTCFETNARFVVDNTNPTARDRQRYIVPAKQAGYEIIGCFFDITLKEALKRNNRRAYKECIPEVGIRATFKKLQIPNLQEGYNKLFRISSSGLNYLIENLENPSKALELPLF
ncbi:hypothetical protein QA601_09510 [Chitinispirillales bacterium ANBcel5]|uniref:AAA family ATPase n=1 Tax=Cellulosispirillum alkaliphilum TaxID=3039283 RepID=UPI002A56136E|nr:hypothetical protein [Chitinispirillales bacterium ANBcel5]